MFAAQYFGQVVFAGVVFVAVVPPPPPPPPVPVPPEICEFFAIGDCIGVAAPTDRVPRRGIASCVPSGRAIGQSGRGNVGQNIGISGGRCP